MAEKQPLTISNSSTLSLTLVFGVVALVVTAVTFTVRTESRLSRLEEEMTSIKVALMEKTVTKKDMQLWTRELEYKNPQMNVPEFIP